MEKTKYVERLKQQIAKRQREAESHLRKQLAPSVPGGDTLSVAQLIERRLASIASIDVEDYDDDEIEEFEIEQEQLERWSTDNVLVKLDSKQWREFCETLPRKDAICRALKRGMKRTAAPLVRCRAADVLTAIACHDDCAPEPPLAVKPRPTEKDKQKA